MSCIFSAPKKTSRLKQEAFRNYRSGRLNNAAMSTVIDGVTDPVEIADLFANKYEDLY